MALHDGKPDLVTVLRRRNRNIEQYIEQIKASFPFKKQMLEQLSMEYSLSPEVVQYIDTIYKLDYKEKAVDSDLVMTEPVIVVPKKPKKPRKKRTPKKKEEKVLATEVPEKKDKEE